MPALFALLGAGIGMGLWLLATGLRPRRGRGVVGMPALSALLGAGSGGGLGLLPPVLRPPPVSPRNRGRRDGGPPPGLPATASTARIAATLAVAAAVGAATGWPVA